jgi:hypothetical protein
MVKDSVPAGALMKNAGKHKRDKKNHTRDEIQKSFF